MKLNGLNSRQFYHQVIFIKNEEALNQMKDMFERDIAKNGDKDICVANFN